MSTNTFRLAGVMGQPIAHSRSPLLHGYWLKQHAIAGCYAPIEVGPGQLEKALRALPPLGFAGVNLTIPLKEEALRIVDRIDPVARRIGAINCVVVAPDGSLDGYNYDAFGYMAALKAAAPDFDAARGPIVVLGAGGAARAVLSALVDEGARDILIANRTRERAQALAEAFAPVARVIDWSQRADALEACNALINTTSMGMQKQPPLDIALDALPRDALVSDIVYAPLETDLLRRARLHGAHTVDGLGMLLHQARPAFRHFYGPTPDVTDDLRRAIEATL